MSASQYSLDSLTRIYNKPKFSTFPRLPMELSDEILGYLLPRHQADDDGRHILVSSYTASLSLHALFLLHSKFQPVVIITNNATYLENRLWYGLPLQPATLYKPRAALEVRLNHDIDADKAREVYVVTGVEFLPHLIYMINGSNYTRVFEIPPTSSFLASMKTITLGFQIQDIFRDSPKFKKYFNAVKGLRKMLQTTGDQTRIRLLFLRVDGKDIDRIKKICNKSKEPALTNQESQTGAQSMMIEALKFLENKNYDKSMLRLTLSANILGRHLCEFSQDFPIPQGLGGQIAMVEIFVHASKAARGLGYQALSFQMIERASQEINWMRHNGNLDIKTDFELTMKVITEMLASQLVYFHVEAMSIAEMFVAGDPNNPIYIDSRTMVKKACRQLASSLISRDSYEGYVVAGMLFRSLWGYFSENLGSYPLYEIWRCRYVRLLPHVVRTWMDRDVTGGFAKAKELLSFESVQFPWALEIFDASVECSARLIEAIGLNAALNFRNTNLPAAPMAIFPRLRPERYITKFEKVILENDETAKGMGGNDDPPDNPLKRKAGQISGQDEESRIVRFGSQEFVVVMETRRKKHFSAALGVFRQLLCVQGDRNDRDAA